MVDINEACKPSSALDTTAWKLNLPLGSEFDSHSPEKMNFFHPKVQRRTRKGCHQSAPIAIDLSPPSSSTSSNDIRIMSPPTSASNVVGVQVKHVTSVEESDYDVRQWHIAQLPKTSKKKCFAKQARTEKTCSEMITRLEKSTHAPTYTRVLHICSQLKNKMMKFFHCMDDIERCVRGINQKWVIGARPLVPNVWPVLKDTKLTKVELLRLKQAGFQLEER